METEITRPAIKGLIISLALICFSVVIAILKQDTNKSLGIIPLVIMLGGIVWACLSYAKQMNGNVTFGNIFSHGFKASALVAAIMGLWIAIYLLILFPEVLDRTLATQRETMQKQGNISEEDIEKYLTVGRKMAVPMGTIVNVILYMVVGAISSLLGAFLAKKNPNPIFPEQPGN